MFYSIGQAIWHGFPDMSLKLITTDCRHFEFAQVDFFRGISVPETTHFVKSNGVAIWHGFPDVAHTKVNNGHF